VALVDVTGQPATSRPEAPMLVTPLTRDGAMPSPCDERERAGPGSGLAAWRLARAGAQALGWREDPSGCSVFPVKAAGFGHSAASTVRSWIRPPHRTQQIDTVGSADFPRYCDEMTKARQLLAVLSAFCVFSTGW